MKRIFTIVAILLAILGGSFYFVRGNMSAEAQEINQQSIVDSISSSLQGQGIQIRSVEIIDDSNFTPSSVIKFVLQSSSVVNKALPGDAVSTSIILHEANLAQERGLKIGAINLSIINLKGNVISDSTVRVKEFDTSELNPPFMLDDSVVKNILIEKMSQYGLSIKEANVRQGTDNLRKVTFNLEVSDIQTANDKLPRLMNGIMKDIGNLNLNQNTQISTYQIELRSSSGEILLQYVNDILLKSQISWQNDELTQDWFPYPKNKF